MSLEWSNKRLTVVYLIISHISGILSIRQNSLLLLLWKKKKQKRRKKSIWETSMWKFWGLITFGEETNKSALKSLGTHLWSE